MNRRTFLKNLGVGAAALTLSGCNILSRKASDNILTQTKPNVVIILSDDVGVGDISCYGAKLVNTPHIDGLVKEGMRFTNAYSNGSVCSPTRYSVLTGAYPCRSWLKKGGVKTSDPMLIRLDQETIASMFKQAGYQTAAIGKWHLGYGSSRPRDWNKPLKPGPLEVGFDYHFGVPNNHNDKIRAYVEKHDLVGRMKDMPFVFAQDGQRVQGILREKERVDDEVDSTLTGKALNFIRENQKRPFFLYFTTCAAHTHITPHERFRGTSPAGQYGDYLQELDYHVGEILDLLDELDLSKNTLVVFSSDNGGQLRDHGSAGKGLNLASEAGDVRRKARTSKIDARTKGHLTNLSWRGGKGGVYEGGFRVPFIVRWPGRTPRATTSDEVVNTADFMATFADIIGRTLPQEAAPDSFSIAEILQNIPPEKRTSIKRPSSILQSAGGVLSFRVGEWKLIQYSRGLSDSERKDELYNLEEDPHEENNLAAKEPERVKSMNTLLKTLIDKGRTRP
ncbi:MAG: sulfatase-like hydrolase/transferase [Planctomycetota bacterium]|jgi:arylsulfatase A-like enzyme